MRRIFVARAYNGVGVHELTRRQERPVKTQPGLVITHFVAVTLSRIGHIVEINDVGGTFWDGCDDLDTGWGDPHRRQRVGSREVRVLPPLVWAVCVGVDGSDGQLRRLDPGIVLLLVGRRRWVPDLLSAKLIRWVLSTTRGGVGKLTGVCLWLLF